MQIEALATARDLAAASRGKLIDWADHHLAAKPTRVIGHAAVSDERTGYGPRRNTIIAGATPSLLLADRVSLQAPVSMSPRGASRTHQDYLFTVDADDRVLEIVPGTVSPFPLPARDTVPLPGTDAAFNAAFWGAVRRVRSTGEPCCVDVTSTSRGVATCYQVWLATAHAGELTGVVCDITEGLLQVFAQSVREETYLRVISDLRAATDKLQSERDTLLELATCDCLTGVWNRQAIFVLLEKALASAHRADRPVTIIMADVDRFKGINDRLGHPAGDAVLREVARRFRSSVRLSDEVGRYGGEEFLFLLPGCGESVAMARAEQFRMAIAGEPILVDGRPLEVTCSFGLHTVRGGSYASDGAVHRADAALYSAKNSGRNCCVSLHE